MFGRIVAGVVFFSFVEGCATVPKRVIRDTQVYTLEILAGLQREQEAAQSLFEAADAARDNGDQPTCRIYVQPALVIQAKAKPQAYRALWLAGLPYPNADGSLPEPGETQPDPGAAPALSNDAAVNYCLTDDPEVDPPGLEVDVHGGDSE